MDHDGCATENERIASMQSQKRGKEMDVSQCYGEGSIELLRVRSEQNKRLFFISRFFATFPTYNTA